MTRSELPLVAISLPYRAVENIDTSTIRAVAESAEAAGFHGLWVSERTVGTVFCLDPLVALSYAAAVTSTIRLGVAVVVSPVHDPIRLAHQYASLDYVSGGRLTLGVGLGRDGHYDDFNIPKEHRVTRLLEGVETVEQLWAGDDVTYSGSVVNINGISVNPKPLQNPRPPIWFGGSHDDALRRAARVGDGWIGAGLQSAGRFVESAERLREHLNAAGRSLHDFVISKRIYVSISDSEQDARDAMSRWFNEVLRRPTMIECGLSGTAEQVRAQLEPLLAADPDHLVLHPVSWSPSMVDDLKRVVST